VYHKKLIDGTYVYLLLYVDDMLIASKCIYEINKLKTLLNNEFEMKNLGAARMILGMEIHRDRSVGKLYLSQKEYIEKVLQQFGMQNVKPMSILLATHFKLSAALSPQSTAEKEHMSHVPYASVVGSIMYAMVCTRPKMSQAVSVVNRYMGNPGKMHWQAEKWILRYLRGTKDIGLVFHKNHNTCINIVG